MPINRVRGGWRYGRTGKVYKQKSKALRQMRAIKASEWRRRRR